MANSGRVKTYDPKQVIVTFKGAIMTDFAEDTFIEVTSEPGFEAAKGADGSENRVNKNETGADATLTLSQASISNDVLNAYYVADKASNTGKGAFTIKDLNGTTLINSAQAYIMNDPDLADGNSMGDRAWTFRLPQVQKIIGGNLT